MSEVQSRVKTAASNLLAGSLLLEENTIKYKQSWMMIDQFEQLKGLEFSPQKEVSEPVRQSQPTIAIGKDNTIQSGKQYYVRQMEFYYYRILCKNQRAPLNCQVYCEGDIQIMASFSNPFPTKFNCDMVIRNRTWNVKNLEDDYLFMSFISRKSTELKFILHFGSSEHKKVQKVQTSYHQYSRVDIPPIPQNIVNSNIAQQTRIQNKFQIEVSRSKRFIKVLQVAQTQRNATTQGSRSRNIDFQVKELVHEEHLVRRLIVQKIHHKKQFEKFWVMALRQAHLFAILSRVFEHKKQIIQRNRMAAFQIRMKFKHLRMYMQATRGDNLQERAIFDCQLTLMMFSKQIIKNLLNIQFQKSLETLKERARLYQIKTKFFETHSKIQLIRKYFTNFIINVQKYKVLMLQKWDQFISKHYQLQLKIKQSERDKRQVAWFMQLQDKQFCQMMQQNFLSYVIRERVKNHFYEQRLIKSTKLEIRQYRNKQKVTTDPLELQICKQRIFKLSSEVFALQMKNQLFIHTDVQKYMLILMDKFVVVQEEKPLKSLVSDQANKKKGAKRAPGRVSYFRST